VLARVKLTDTEGYQFRVRTDCVLKYWPDRRAGGCRLRLAIFNANSLGTYSEEVLVQESFEQVERIMRDVVI
jgi:hypothetical protein